MSSDLRLWLEGKPCISKSYEGCVRHWVSGPRRAYCPQSFVGGTVNSQTAKEVLEEE